MIWFRENYNDYIILNSFSIVLEKVFSILGIWYIVFIFIVIFGVVINLIKLYYKLEVYSV